MGRLIDSGQDQVPAGAQGSVEETNRPAYPNRRDLIPSYGEHMTVREFEECCRNGLFVNDDGVGYYAGIMSMTRIPVDCRSFYNGIYERRYTHVVWFNK